MKYTDLSFLVVVPTLNSSHLLTRLVSSLQVQTWPSWRVLFVDGPSTSEHRQWLQDITDSEARCKWVKQEKDSIGIFGAMNQGFSHASSSDYLLFWGSDDWASSRFAFAKIAALLADYQQNGRCPDLLVFRGQYVDLKKNRLGRKSYFRALGYLNNSCFRRSLFWGSTPPHQGTLIGPNIRHKLNQYDSSLMLTADLDYFLRLSLYQGINILSTKLVLVNMGLGGASSQQTKRRLLEVQRSYISSFGGMWWFPFILRYISRFISVFQFTNN